MTDESHKSQWGRAVSDDRIIYRDLSYQVVGAAFEVHNTLGPGFLEAIYEEAMVREFLAREIPFQRQVAIPVKYKGVIIGKHRLDLLVDKRIIVELKAGSEIPRAAKRQVLSYLKATNLRLGLVIDFGPKGVDHSRIVL